jgi:hypothetical protein
MRIRKSLNEGIYDEDYGSPYDLAYSAVEGPDSVCHNPYSRGTSEFYEYRTGYEDAMLDNGWTPIRESRRRVNEAISRKQKERLNLLNDIVNFAYEYGENETKTLFQQAFKKAIGDDLIESLSDDE